MRSRGLHRVEDSLVVIVRVGVNLGEPDDLLGINRLTVNYRRNLSVRSACVKADTAAAKVSSNRASRALLLGSILKRGKNYLKGLFVNSLHKAHVEISRATV